jgi:hypothetical protein
MNMNELPTNHPSYTLSPKENNAVNCLLAIAADFNKNNNSKKMATASPLAQGKKHVAKHPAKTTGYYITNAPCGLQALHAYIEAEDNTTKIEEAYNDHHSINYYAVSLPKPVHDREFHTSVITKVECRKGHNSQRSLLHRRESEKRSPRSSSG